METQKIAIDVGGNGLVEQPPQVLMLLLLPMLKIVQNQFLIALQEDVKMSVLLAKEKGDALEIMFKKEPVEILIQMIV